ncbi:hypothetical protein D9758_000193 [Tetrapyrgos nigripes]|uniref:FMR1-interacting protein 1 conserved domain-containing protein n=1 Tax=Tetrapyrgos nigripes TaxID=182062 RepID=A0A8H5H0Y9_9AGAR|nr:hypothetical protein D9758_000193 [Tetrapyrgos nigripes]
MPLPPRPNFTPQNHNSYATSQAFHGIPPELANPFPQACSSHYAQAYMQNYAPQPLTTPEGYTYSSTYTSAAQPTLQYATAPKPPKTSIFAANSTWYQPGNVRCTYKNCTFTGSSKTVEIHMMDRHLIYPPGWEKRKKTQDWDADPSFKGKSIPIQGTKILLDTPAAVEAWIAERKKRWPTSERVEEKKRKLEEATARGQFTAEELGLFSKKRRRVEDDNHVNNGRGRGMRGRGRGGRRGGFADIGLRGRGTMNEKQSKEINKPEAMDDATVPTPQAPTLPMTNTADSSLSDDSDDDSEPEVVSSKVSSKVDTIASHQTNTDALVEDPKPAPKETKPPVLNRQPRQPKRPPPNPFAPKTSLLRNLLLPEIRMTVSNLSQAIRFIVDNDFLRDVEVKPGEADEALIKVESSTTIDTDSQSSSA